MLRGRRKGRGLTARTERPGSQDSATQEPREKETKLSKDKDARLTDHQTTNIFLRFYSRTEESVYEPAHPPLPDCTATPLPDCPVMDKAATSVEEVLNRDSCDSPTMPLLSPEVPSFGEISCVVKDGPPVLSQYGIEDACDQGSEKSEGDSGKENEEDSPLKWRGSRSSLSSRTSRPRSGPFNQINIRLNQTDKKAVLGQANLQGPVTRSSISPRPASITSHLDPKLASKLGSNLEVSKEGTNLDWMGSPTKPRLTMICSSLTALETRGQPLQSPVKMPSTPQSPMSPHKIQIPDRPSLTDKLKLAISKSPKTFSTSTSKRSSLRKGEGTKGSTKKLGKLAQAAEGSRQITDYFPIRRSERKKKSEIEKDKMEGIEARLLATDDSDLDLEIIEIALKGRGIVTKRAFEKGEFVLEYSGELIDIGSARDRETVYSLDTSKGCYMYYFNHKEKQYCIDATTETGRFGRLVNHSCKTPNCVTKVVMLGEEPRLILVAKQDIEAATELLYDYGDRSKESLKAHPWLTL